ncbi:MAG TPA: histidine--tRNA ligase [Clostridia bacterium]|nr:histidine--tRNA ligase [Clostridia bacterium]
MLTTAPRGTKDILPGEVEKWQKIEKKARELCHLYGYQEIRTPLFEHTELFTRSIGETTDIVSKEMYTFTDRGGRSITLRPEGTASTIRAYLEQKIYNLPQPTKLYYIGPMFRYDRPQAGRYRQFHQFGIEVLGVDHPAIDAEVISLALHFLNSLGLNSDPKHGGLTLHINSIGCPECRARYRDKLLAYIRDNIDQLCPDCRSRYERNPLRILDCKQKQCQTVTKDAPHLAEYLCSNCDEHFTAVKHYLDLLNIEYVEDPRLVRGLDYYTNTAFEIISTSLGAQSSICGGGRYNGLVEACGGSPTPGIGFAIGLERLLLLLPEDTTGSYRPDVFLLAFPGLSYDFAYTLQAKLRKENISVVMDYLQKSLRSQMRYANKLQAKNVVIIGDEELETGTVTLKKMDSGEQTRIKLDDLVNYLKK